MIIYTVYIQNSIYNNHTGRSCLFIYYLYESIIINTIMHIMCLLSFTAPSPLPSLPNPPSSIFGRSRSHTSSRIPSPTLCCACPGESRSRVVFGFFVVLAGVLELLFFFLAKLWTIELGVDWNGYIATLKYDRWAF